MRDLALGRADERERRRDLLAQRLERAQQHRKALARDRLADERDPQRLARAREIFGAIAGRLGAVAGRQRGVRLGRLGGERQLMRARDAHAVGDDPVAATVEAARRPRGRLRDGDARVQAVHPPAAAERNRGDAVRKRVLRVGVERADERQLAGRQQRVPAEQRHDRLVDVRDVVAAVAQLAAQRADRARRERHVRDGAVRRDADGAPERDEAVGCRMPLGARAAVQSA